MFTVSNFRSQREPKIFVFFPEVQEKLVKYCNERIKEGDLSTEQCAVEVRTKIIRESYDNLLEEAGDDREEMPSYNKILSMCDLKTISFSTIWRWLM